MVERAIVQMFEAGPGGLDAIQAGPIVSGRRFDGFTSAKQAHPGKVMMPADHWPKMLDQVLMEILRRASAPHPDRPRRRPARGGMTFRRG